MRYALALATLVLAACGNAEDRHWERLESTYCEAYDACHTGDAPCPFSLSYDRPDDLSCTFDKKKSRDCLKGEFVCNAEFGAGNEWIEAPEICGEVYACTMTEDTSDTGEDTDA